MGLFHYTAALSEVVGSGYPSLHCHTIVIGCNHRSLIMLSIGVTFHHTRVGGPHPFVIPWVPRLPEIVHNLTKNPEDRGYRPSMLWGQWQLRSISTISNATSDDSGDRRG